jgi:hypothetical protein
MIDKGMIGSTVLCVLIGAETYTRRWVDYEILKAVTLGMGVFGIRIHQLRDPATGQDEAGPNPFDFLGLGEHEGKLTPMIKYESGWKNAPYQSSASRTTAYLRGTDKPVLSQIFSVYDWVDQNGYLNFQNWVEAAAHEADI